MQAERENKYRFLSLFVFDIEACMTHDFDLLIYVVFFSVPVGYIYIYIYDGDKQKDGQTETQRE